MSRHWMKMYWADYLADTMHLTQGQHGAYMLLIAHYWNKGELLAKHCYSIARAMSEQDRSNVDEVLEQFFVLEGEGPAARWISARVEKELAEAGESYKRRAEAGYRGGKARAAKQSMNSDEAMLKQCSSNAQAESKQPEPEPDISITGVIDIKGAAKKPPRFDASAYLQSSGVEKQLADDWLAVRKAKKAAPTKTAIDGVMSEAAKAGISISDALRVCCERGWAGFKSSWHDQPQAPPHANHRKTIGEERADTIAALTGRSKQHERTTSERDITAECQRIA